MRKEEESVDDPDEEGKEKLCKITFRRENFKFGRKVHGMAVVKMKFFSTDLFSCIHWSLSASCFAVAHVCF